jgi:catechol 2,3-dioxygenase-like lactoylglutathione lyase family enzyme
MKMEAVIPQLRTTDLAASIRFYTTVLGFALDFEYEDFYAGVRTGDQVIHLKRVDESDPSIAWVESGDHFHLYFGTDDVEAAADTVRKAGATFVKDLHQTPWGTREFAIRDDQGHRLYFGQTS